MKPEQLTALIFNGIIALIGIVFSFTNIFIEITEIKYTISQGTTIFGLNYSALHIFAIIFMLALVLLAIATFVIYCLAMIKKRKKLYNTLIILLSVCFVAFICFILFSHLACIDNTVFGFGKSTEYKFTFSMIFSACFYAVFINNILWFIINGYKKAK